MPDKIAVGYVSRTFFSVPLWAAEENGYFAAEDLEVSTTVFGSTPHVPMLLDGSLNFVIGSPELALENAEAVSKSNADWVEAQLLYARTLLVTGRSDDSLAIASELAARMGGSIELASKPGETVFTLLLPRADGVFTSKRSNGGG